MVAEVRNNGIVWDGKAYASLSAAAVAAIISTGSKNTKRDGWLWGFYFDDLDNTWKPLHHLPSKKSRV